MIMNFLDRFSGKKNSYVKFPENTSSVSRVVLCGRDEADSRFSQFYEHVQSVLVFSLTLRGSRAFHYCGVRLCEDG